MDAVLVFKLPLMLRKNIELTALMSLQFLAVVTAISSWLVSEWILKDPLWKSVLLNLIIT